MECHYFIYCTDILPETVTIYKLLQGLVTMKMDIKMLTEKDTLYQEKKTNHSIRDRETSCRVVFDNQIAG
jgi:hypothetical protein